MGSGRLVGPASVPGFVEQPLNPVALAVSGSVTCSRVAMAAIDRDRQVDVGDDRLQQGIEHTCCRAAPVMAKHAVPPAVPARQVPPARRGRRNPPYAFEERPVGVRWPAATVRSALTHLPNRQTSSAKPAAMAFQYEGASRDINGRVAASKGPRRSRTTLRLTRTGVAKATAINNQ